MKAALLTLLFSFLTFAVFAEVKLRGIITYQNTGKKMNALQITARGASPTISKANSNEGVFILTFPNGKVGDLVTMELGTPFYDLVNDPRELTITLTDNPNYTIRIVVCKKGERDANAVTYYNISTKYLEKNYQKDVQKKNAEITKLEKQLAEKGANETELTKQLYTAKAERARLDEALESQKKNAYKMAEDFSYIDLAQADAIYRKAFETFKTGDIEGARAFLNSTEAKKQEADLVKLELDIKNSEAQVKTVGDSLIAAKTKIADAKLQRDTLKASVIKKKFLDGQLAILQNKYDDAERLYTEGVNLDSTNIDNIWTLAIFLYYQNEVQKDIFYYEKALSLSKSEDLVGTFCNGLGLCYSALNKIPEAEKYYLKSLDIRERLSKSNPQQFEAALASTAMNLGSLYHNLNKMPEAEKYYLKSLDICERLSKSNPQKFEEDLAKIAGNLGTFYKENKKMPEAEKYYLKSLDICERLSKSNLPSWNEKEGIVLDSRERHNKSNPQQFENSLAITTMNLGNFYRTLKKMPEAEKYYLKSLDINERLSKSNPQRFEVYLANTATNLGGFYMENKKMPEAEKYYLKSLDITERLSKSNPQKFEAELAFTAANLGFFYQTLKKMPEAEKYYLTSLDIYERLSKSNPQQFEGRLASMAMNLGFFYQTLKKMPEAEKYYLTSLDIYERLSKSNPQQFEGRLASMAMNLGFFYETLKKMPEAEKYYLKSLDINERLSKSNPQQFEEELATTAMYLGNFYYNLKKMPEAEKYYLKSLDINERLSKSNPQQFEAALARTAMYLGIFYQTFEKMPEVEKYFLKSLDIYERLSKSNPQQFEEELAKTLNKFGLFCGATKQFDKAQTLYSRALALRQKALLNGQIDFLNTYEYNQVFNNMGDLLDSFDLQKNHTKVVEIQTERAKSSEILRGVLENGNAGAAQEYAWLSWYQLFAQKYAAAEQSATQGLTLDPTQTWIKTNLAHALLFQNKEAAAQKIYDELKNQKNTRGKSYRDILHKEFDSLEKAGLDKKQLDKARKWVKE
jgi:predicted Zn-dependent protease